MKKFISVVLESKVSLKKAGVKNQLSHLFRTVMKTFLLKFYLKEVEDFDQKPQIKQLSTTLEAAIF